ncbi:DHH family phosphoesterase [Halomonas denitrificans]|nr:DHH family phosphoesterase [Halomonas denitrificans]
MSRYDVFNGDADGIFALLQLRRVHPCDAILVTDIKREVALLSRLPAVAGDQVTVLDLSMASNRDDLERLLAAGVNVEYVDHHHAGEPLQHPRLRATIDLSPHTCTSLLVDRMLSGRARVWALAGAYGDNLLAEADALAQQMGLTEAERDAAHQLGTLVNYNGYGRHLDDLHLHPAELYRALQSYDTPLQALSDPDSPVGKLQQGYQADLNEAEALQPERQTPGGRVYRLPDAAWVHRISGVFANALANAHPKQAIALMTPTRDGHWRVSVRAPLAHPQGADLLCRQFATGGGRARAAGINLLEAHSVADFIAAFEQQYPGIK